MTYIAKLMVNTKHNPPMAVHIGTIRELPNGKWVWHALGRAARKQHDTKDACFEAARRALASGLYIKENDK